VTEHVDEAVARARQHMIAAALEGLEAAAALLDAAAGAGARPEPATLTRELAARLRGWSRGLPDEHQSRLPPALSGALEEALSREIQRWKLRASTDPEAHLVLRAFLGLRALLRELDGREPESTPSEPSSGRAAPAERPDRATRPRVQRFDVEG